MAARTINMQEFEEVSGNVFKGLLIIAKRARQINDLYKADEVQEYEEVIRYIKSQITPTFSMRIDVEGYSDPDLKVGFCNPFHGIAMDHQGNLIFCCNLSHPTAKDRPDTFGKEFLGNIAEIGIEEGLLRHYRLMGWFMEKVINANVTQEPGSNCTNCFHLFGKMEWIKDYESPYNRNC